MTVVRCADNGSGDDNGNVANDSNVETVITTMVMAMARQLMTVVK